METDEPLGSPFRLRSNSAGPGLQQASAPTSATKPSNTTATKARPPMSGSGSTRDKSRKVSNNSLHTINDGNGLSKDELLERMAEALRKERAKNRSYMKELVEAENEVSSLYHLSGHE